jgi:LiaF transmembrane domain
MKTVNIFWGTLFISAGLLWLNNEFGLIAINTDWTMQYWPFLIIIIGISILINSKTIRTLASLVSALFLSLLIYHNITEIPQNLNDIRIEINKEAHDFWDEI